MHCVYWKYSSHILTNGTGVFGFGYHMYVYKRIKCVYDIHSNRPLLPLPLLECEANFLFHSIRQSGFVWLRVDIESFSTGVVSPTTHRSDCFVANEWKPMPYWTSQCRAVVSSFDTFALGKHLAFWTSRVLYCVITLVHLVFFWLLQLLNKLLENEKQSSAIVIPLSLSWPRKSSYIQVIMQTQKRRSQAYWDPWHQTTFATGLALWTLTAILSPLTVEKELFACVQNFRKRKFRINLP